MVRRLRGVLETAAVVGRTSWRWPRDRGRHRPAVPAARLVPYLVGRQGIPLAEAAAEFGISQAQLVKDLELLFVCGTPGHLPDDLIDVDWDDGNVFLSNADPIARPLRLDVDEALALLVGLRALTDVPGLHDRDALQRTLLKLEAAAGDAATASGQVRVEVEGARRRWPRSAARWPRAAGCTCPTSSRPATRPPSVTSTRCGSLLVDGRWYLEGWCRRAEDVRLFRLDRVDAITLLDLPAEVPAAAAERDLAEGLFIASPDDIPVTLELAPPAHWVADYYAGRPGRRARRRPPARRGSASPTTPGCGSWPCASAARCGCSTRPSWPTTWRRPPGAPWRPTPLSDPVSVTQMALWASGWPLSVVRPDHSAQAFAEPCRTSR